MPRFYDIANVGKGRIFTGPRPTQDDLQDWCLDARRHGITHVISLIKHEEAERYGITGEGEELGKQGIAFTHFPIEDFSTPGVEALHSLSSKLHAELLGGGTIMAHCAGGVGRAGTLASCLLVTDGMKPDDAMRLVSERRGVASPETGGQVDFIRRFARHIG